MLTIKPGLSHFKKINKYYKNFLVVNLIQYFNPFKLKTLSVGKIKHSAAPNQSTVTLCAVNVALTTAAQKIWNRQIALNGLRIFKILFINLNKLHSSTTKYLVYSCFENIKYLRNFLKLFINCICEIIQSCGQWLYLGTEPKFFGQNSNLRRLPRIDVSIGKKIRCILWTP